MTRHRHQATALAMVLIAALGATACGGGGSGGGGGGGGGGGMMGGTTTVSLASVSTNPTTVNGCGTSQVTATLSGPAPSGGVPVSLTASPTGSVVFSSNTITIPAGATTGTATVSQPQPTALNDPSGPVTAPATVTVTGTTAAASGIAASSQVGMMSLAAPIALFTVSRTSGSTTTADTCQITNSSGNALDCTFNGSTSTNASVWSWEWQIGGTTRTASNRNTPTLAQPDTGGCGFFGSPTPGSQVQMQVRLTVRDTAGATSCVRRNLNVRVLSGGFCGGF